MSSSRMLSHISKRATPGIFFMLCWLLLSSLLVSGCGLRGITQASPPVVNPTATATPTPASLLKAGLPDLHVPPPTATGVPLAVEQQPSATLAVADVAMVEPTVSSRTTATPSQRERTPALVYQNPVLAAGLQQLLDTVAERPGHPGITMYVHVDGVGTWVGAAGLANRETEQPVQPDDRFRIASVSKTFVATVVLQLVQEGVLGLDDSVEQWLPGVVPNGANITVRQLLSHTSGLYDYLDYHFEQLYFGEEPLRVWRPAEMVGYGVSKDTYFAPGEPGKWKYSNTNYILLGMIVEQASGESLAHELRTRIFEPLGLNNTFLEDYEEIPAGFVRGYIGDDDYTYASLCAWAAGGIVSNAEDVATFAQALFAGELLRAPMMQEMLSFVPVDFPAGEVYHYPLYGLGVARNIEGLSLATQGAAPAQTRFAEVWGHIGGLSGFKSVMAYTPDNGVTVVVLVNQMYVQVVPVVLDALTLVEGATR